METHLYVFPRSPSLHRQLRIHERGRSRLPFTPFAFLFLLSSPLFLSSSFPSSLFGATSGREGDFEMSPRELLEIDPLELKFPCQDDEPEEVLRQAQCWDRSAPIHMRCYWYANLVSAFSRESGNVVDEVKLRVLYVSPPQPPSPVPEGSEEDSSPRPSVSDNGNSNASELLAVSILHDLFMHRLLLACYFDMEDFDCNMDVGDKSIC
ncbi:hypothetical protein BHM03_00052875 [Ensete ventricosum]|uniref:Uncharacterized protein n=1 Tax=Ensete ventricosum TaxID=4639 RepID=A0A445MLU7_ENSVE|nr:hypothetical protein BHM03_00052875 [Ensete ventricosum]